MDFISFLPGYIFLAGLLAVATHQVTLELRDPPPPNPEMGGRRFRRWTQASPWAVIGGYFMLITLTVGPFVYRDSPLSNGLHVPTWFVVAFVVPSLGSLLIAASISSTGRPRSLILRGLRD